MARCGDCNKFVSLDSDSDPEINLDVGEDGAVSGDVRIENNCAECGTTLRSCTFDVAVSADEIKDENGKTLASWLEGLTPQGRESVSFEIEEGNVERTSRTEGKGRGVRTFYGALVEFDVIAKIEGDETAEPKTIDVERTFSGRFEDDVQASSMDEEG